MELVEPCVSTDNFLTIADVIARLDADDGLRAEQKASMISALETVCRVLDADARALAADPGTLRERLSAISPGVARLSRGRWSNVRSLTISALRRVGVPTMWGRSQLPLSAEWRGLAAGLPRETLWGLSRFISFCSAHAIRPGTVTADTFQRFRDALYRGSLVRDPRRLYRTTCLLGNKVAETVPGWPGLRVTPPKRSAGFTFRLEEFPLPFRADVESYLAHRANDDPFADDYARPARPGTLKTRRQQIIEIASALVRSDYPIEDVTALSILVQPENAKRALQFFWTRAGKKRNTRIYGLAVFLKALARRWIQYDSSVTKEAHLRVLGELCSNLSAQNSGMTGKNRGRLRQFADPSNLEAFLGLPDRLVRQIKREDRDRRTDALQVALAVAIELLTVAPMRISNLTGLDMHKHICRSRPGSDAVIHITLAADEVKNGVPYQVALPKRSAALLDLYLEVYRPRLIKVPSPWLFPNHEGDRRVTASFAQQIVRVIHREIGLTMNCHLFRHLAVMIYLDAHPEDIETARRILGHKSLTTTLKSYAEIKTACALRRYDALIAELRDRPVIRHAQRGQQRRIEPAGRRAA